MGLWAAVHCPLGLLWGRFELQSDLAQHFSEEQAGVLAGCSPASGLLHCRANDAETQGDTVTVALLALVLLSASGTWMADHGPARVNVYLYT